MPSAVGATGRFFPEFRRAELAGATADGSSLKMRSIDVGLRMELHVDGESFVTSTIRGVSPECGEAYQQAAMRKRGRRVARTPGRRETGAYFAGLLTAVGLASI